MKINSNTIKLEKESYEKLESIVKKIASENKIENVSGVEIKISKENGIIKFAMGEEFANWQTKSMAEEIINNDKVYGTLAETPSYLSKNTFEKTIVHLMPEGVPGMDTADYERIRWSEVFYAVVDALDHGREKDKIRYREMLNQGD